MAARVVTTSIDSGVITINVAGEYLMFDPRDAHAQLRMRAEYHGWVQRLSDAAALGAGSTPVEKREAIRALINHYASGTDEWDLRGGSRTTLTLLAVAEIQGLTPAQMREALMTKAEKAGITYSNLLAKLSKCKDVVGKCNEIRARSATETSVDDVLDNMAS